MLLSRTTASLPVTGTSLLVCGLPLRRGQWLMEPLVLKTLFGTITFSKDGVSFDGLTFSWDIKAK